MKRILVNMNRSGYFWHELNDTSLSDAASGTHAVKMNREISDDSHPSITALRTYEQYNYVFMKGNGDYILAIRNLNDPRTDSSGRSLKQHVIFEDDDKDLLLKLLAFYLSCPEQFERWITGECFKPGQNDALCKLAPFYKKIEELKKCEIDTRLQNCEFAISSQQNARWLQEKLQIRTVNVEDYQNKLDSLRKKALLKATIDLDNCDNSSADAGTPTPSVPSEDTTSQPNVTESQPTKTTDSVPAGIKDNEVDAKLIKIQQDLKKWKMCTWVSAAVASVSIIALLYFLLNK